MVEGKHRARIDVSLELIRNLLGMPDDAQIVAVEWEPQRGLVMTLWVEHPDLPEVLPGVVVPRITPIVNAIRGACGHVDKITLDWNVPKSE